MSGILERIEAKLDQLLAGTAAAAPQALAQPLPAAAAPLAPAAAPLAPAAPAAAPVSAYPPATQEMIVALVTPLVNDPNVKSALQAEMQAMGIAALPEAQPHQYPELYARFQRVQQQVAAQQAAAPQPAASPASII